MLFNSIEFVIFFFIVYTLYIFLPLRWQNGMLLVASYIFYGAWDWRFLGIMLFSTLLAYYCGHSIAAAPSASQKKTLMMLGVVINLCFLGFFKYFNFFAESLQALVQGMGVELNILELNIILPIGISFYTFHNLGYCVDVYRGKYNPLENLFDFALYVSFFPQLVAGPIERATRLLPQIINPRKISASQVRLGIWLILMGYYQKVFIADNLAKIVNGIFADTHPTSGSVALLGTYAFAFQIYGDFAGYSNIARGVSALMGFDIMQNFDSPYLARNPTDFWRRWHISLSTWLRDYLYIPLGGNRKGVTRTYINLMITMLLGGLWHGATWTFVFWGGWHGLLLVVYRLCDFTTTTYQNIKEKISINNILNIVLMFHLTCISWLFFRAESFEQAFNFLWAIFTDFSIKQGGGLGNAVTLVKTVWLIVLLDVASWLKGDLDYKVVLKFPGLLRVSIFVVMLLSIILLGQFGDDQFIYFQF